MSSTERKNHEVLRKLHEQSEQQSVCKRFLSLCFTCYGITKSTKKIQGRLDSNMDTDNDRNTNKDR